jgi:hypothetical protein
MKRLICLLIGLSLFLIACGKQAEPKKSETNAPAAAGNPLTAPVDYLGAMGRAKQLAVKTVDLNAINQAIQLFYAEESRFPKDLSELISSKYLSKLPPPPYGMQYVYNSQMGKISLIKAAAPPAQ